MTFKNSYLTSMLENFKRRTWLYAILSLFFILYFPVAVIISNQSVLAYADRYAALTPPQAGQLIDTNMLGYLQDIRDNMTMHLGFNVGFAFILIICAVLCALQGFGYLDSRQKVDFYHSLPVSKTKRFSIIYLNGFLAAAVPYLVSLLLSLLATGFISWDIAGELAPYALLTFFLNILFFLAVYSAATIAVLLTGNKVIAFLGAVFLLLYEFFFRALIDIFSITFFKSYSYYNYSMESTLTSPVVLYFVKLGEMDTWSASLIRTNSSLGASAILPLILFTIVYTAVAYWLFLKRPSEAGGKAIAFPITKPVLRLMTAVPISAITGLFIYEMTVENIFYLFFGCIIGLLLSHGIIEVIFEFELRACLRHGRQLLIGGALVLLFYSIFQFDLLGYDRYVPNPNKVKDVAVILPSGNQTFYNFYENSVEFSYNSSRDYQFLNSKVADVEAVCSLAQESYRNFTENYADIWPKDVTEIELKYNMKNGDTVYRTLRVNYKDSEELLNRIFTDPGYKQGAYQIFDKNIFTAQTLANCKLFYSNGVDEAQLPPWMTEEFLDIYRQDLLSLSFTESAYGLACGEINLNYKHKTDNNSNYNAADWNFPVYPSFQNTIAFLKENNVYFDEYLSLDKVYCVSVLNYPSESDTDYNPDYYGGQISSRDSAVQAVDYTDERQIKEILPALYPSRLASYSLHDYVSLLSNCEARINSPTESGDNDTGGYSDAYASDSLIFSIIVDKAPEFILTE